MTQSNSLGYLGINSFEQPRFLSARRTPNANDFKIPGTQWLVETADPKKIFITTGSGDWLEVATATAPSVQWSDHGVTSLVSSNTGSVSTAAITLTLPTSPSNGDTCEFILGASLNLNVAANTGHTIRIGSVISAAAGTASTAVLGNSLKLVYNTTLTSWLASSLIGNWAI